MNKSQAILEMAIFGTIILTLLATVISYVQRMNDQHYVAHEAFRSALKQAHDAYDGQGASVSYTIFDHNRSVNPFSPVRGEKGQVSGSAVVYWAVPTAEDEDDEDYDKELSETWYKFGEYAVNIKDDFNTERIKNVDVDGSTNVRDITTVVENPQRIVSGQSVGVDESVSYTFKDRNDVPLRTYTVYLHDDGKYYDTPGTPFTRERTWITNRK